MVTIITYKGGEFLYQLLVTMKRKSGGKTIEKHWVKGVKVSSNILVIKLLKRRHRGEGGSCFPILTSFFNGGGTSFELT